MNKRMRKKVADVWVVKVCSIPFCLAHAKPSFWNLRDVGQQRASLRWALRDLGVSNRGAMRAATRRWFPPRHRTGATNDR